MAKTRLASLPMDPTPGPRDDDNTHARTVREPASGEPCRARLAQAVPQPEPCPSAATLAAACRRATSPAAWQRRRGGGMSEARGGEKATMNRLGGESSPYLRLHRHNPVDWYPWGPEALERARREDKPIFLSVGYSTCYWCHVMERESFSNPAIAERMNR